MENRNDMFSQMKMISESMKGIHSSTLFSEPETIKKLQSKFSAISELYRGLNYQGAVAGLNAFANYSSQLKKMSSIIGINNLSTTLATYKNSLTYYSKTIEDISMIGIQLSRVCNFYGDKYDYLKLAETLQQVITSSKTDSELSIDELTDTIANEYEDDINCICVENTNEKGNKDKSIIKNKLLNLIAIISFIVMIYDHVFEKPTIIYNNTTEVNNYYVNELEIDADILNVLYYRFINQNNVMPRIKPDMSSRVVAHLNIGQMILIEDQYKKWIKICWKDENGNEVSGWVQNYKVSKFK